MSKYRNFKTVFPPGKHNIFQKVSKKYCFYLFGENDLF